ncbi:MAG: NAD(P)-dependent oxidoreductase [Labilithrix sp.]
MGPTAATTEFPGRLRADLDETLAPLEPIWRDLRGARLFLTGATGFFGTWLLSSLAWARQRLGAEVSLTILTRDPTKARSALTDAAGATLVGGDVRSFAFPDGEFSHVVHGATAASAALNSNAPREMFDVIVEGTRHVLDFADRARSGRLLFVSSGGVYGAQTVTHVREDDPSGPDPMNPANAYHEGKRAAELLCAIGAKGLVSARGFAYVAPHLPLDIHFAIGNFIRDALAGGPIRIGGDGTPYRSYMYGTDLAVWLWTLLVNGSERAAYNVGSDDGRPLREIADRVAAVSKGLGRDVEVHVAKQAPPNHVPSRYVPNVDRARALGLGLTVDLDEAIRRTIQFHRAAERLESST